jgi:hypothetical protein
VNAFACRIEPLMQVGVIGNQLLHFRVGLVNIFRIAG